jgi:hypothetical protein
VTRRLLAIGTMAAIACLAQGRGAARGGGGGRGGGAGIRGGGGPVHVFTPVRPSLGPIGHGFGNVVFPATGIPNSLYSFPTTFAQRLSATVSGYPGYAVGGRQGRRGLVGGGYALPVLVGGYGYGYDPAYVA